MATSEVQKGGVEAARWFFCFFKSKNPKTISDKKHPQDKKQQQQKTSSFLNVAVVLDLKMVTVKPDQTVQTKDKIPLTLSAIEPNLQCYTTVAASFLMLL